MLEPASNIKVISHYTKGLELLEGIKLQMPDVILMDIVMPDIQGPELCRAVKELYPSVNILAVTSLSTPGNIRNMMQSGCSGYLLKNTDQKVLIDAIEKTFAGEEYIEPALKEHIVQSLLRFKEKSTAKDTSKEIVLTRREKEILQLIIQENSNQEIADKLFLSLRTVENHRFNLQHKLQVKNMIGLIKVAIQMGLV
jgi:DNA-binding NarL/FixJ family response regulator